MSVDIKQDARLQGRAPGPVQQIRLGQDKSFKGLNKQVTLESCDKLQLMIIDVDW